MNKKRNPFFTAVVIGLAVLAGMSEGQSGERKFEKKFSVTSGGILSVTTEVGSIVVTGGAAGEVVVVAEMEGRDRDMKEFEVTAEKTAKGVDVAGRFMKERRWFWNSRDLEVHFSIQVPHEYGVTLTTSGGSIDIRNIKGDAKGGTSGGSLSVADVEGDVRLNTSGGSVKVERGKGLLLLQTSGGSIKVTTHEGDVDAQTSGGSIKIVDVEGKVQAETSGGGIAAELRGANKGATLETSGGSIDITIPESTAADVDLSTSGGWVTCDIPVSVKGKIDETSVRGTINGGGNVIRAHTSGGNVHLRATASK